MPRSGQPGSSKNLCEKGKGENPVFMIFTLLSPCRDLEMGCFKGIYVRPKEIVRLFRKIEIILTVTHPVLVHANSLDLHAM